MYVQRIVSRRFDAVHYVKRDADPPLCAARYIPLTGGHLVLPRLNYGNAVLSAFQPTLFGVYSRYYAAARLIYRAHEIRGPHHRRACMSGLILPC